MARIKPRGDGPDGAIGKLTFVNRIVTPGARIRSRGVGDWGLAVGQDRLVVAIPDRARRALRCPLVFKRVCRFAVQAIGISIDDLYVATEILIFHKVNIPESSLRAGDGGSCSSCVTLKLDAAGSTVYRSVASLRGWAQRGRNSARLWTQPRYQAGFQ